MRVTHRIALVAAALLVMWLEGSHTGQMGLGFALAMMMIVMATDGDWR